MSVIDDYLATLPSGQREVVERYLSRVPALVPEAVPGTKYAMACWVYRDRGLVAVLARKGFFAVVPFSGSLHRELDGEFATSEKGGSIRFTADDPFPTGAFDRLVMLRKAQIDD